MISVEPIAPHLDAKQNVCVGSVHYIKVVDKTYLTHGYTNCVLIDVVHELCTL